MFESNNFYQPLIKKLKRWTKLHYLQIAVFNILLMILFLLRSAGYFDPYFLITINFIVSISLIISIFLLGARSSAFFAISLFFWFFAAFLKIMKIDVWAERTTVYVYQALVLGVILLLFENIKIRSR